MTARIYRISISKSRGEKKGNVECARFQEGYGIVGDAHAGSPRQVSLLPYESFAKFKEVIPDIEPGDFAENLTTIGLDFSGIDVDSRLRIGEDVILVVTAIGKVCHYGCYIRERVGDCIMPREGVFARVARGGMIREGDRVELLKPVSSSRGG
jgi:MOSC domain-containing protein YiiM